MTKSKSNSKAKAKGKSKNAKSGIPKKVAGVKVPKAVRESSSLATLFNSALSREIIADALIAAAGAAAAALTRSRAAKNAGNAAVDAGADAASIGSEFANTAAGAVANVVSEAAKTVLPPSLVGGDEPAKGSGQDDKAPRYVHLASDHNARKVSRKADKGDKTDKS